MGNPYASGRYNKWLFIFTFNIFNLYSINITSLKANIFRHFWRFFGNFQHFLYVSAAFSALLTISYYGFWGDEMNWKNLTVTIIFIFCVAPILRHSLNSKLEQYFQHGMFPSVSNRGCVFPSNDAQKCTSLFSLTLKLSS